MRIPQDAPDHGGLFVVVQDHKIQAVRFADEQATHPAAFDGTTLDLIGRRHFVRSKKVGTPAFSMVIYEAGATRGKKGVKLVTGLVLDFDHLPTEIAEEIRRLLLENGYAFVTYTSYSHRKKGDDDCCFRVILYFSRPVLPNEYERVWEVVNARLGDHADRSARDASRIWFVPSCPPERAELAVLDAHDGLALDVDAIIGDEPLPSPSRRKRRRRPPVEDETGPIPQGERNARLLRLAGAMRRQGANRDSIAAALHETNKARCQPPLEEAEVESIADSVTRYEPASVLVAANKTDLGNAERFVAHCGDRFRFVHPWDSWLHYDGNRWIRDLSGEVIRAARDTLRAIANEAETLPDPEEQDALRKHALESESSARITAMVSLAQAYLPLPPEALDTDLDVLNCLNGTLNLKTGEFLPHRREDFITKVVPVSYDPSAECAMWEAFLGRILGGRASLIAFLRRAVGYSLTGRVREQCLFLLYGIGANGKSTFLETIRAVLGEFSTQADFTTFLKRDTDGARNDLARLVGTRLVAAVEAEAGRRLDEPLVKQLTGGDTICARFLFREFFDYKPQFKIWLAANHKPGITGSDHGIWRRIRLIPFTITIPEGERDLELPQKLLAELPGILAWAVRGAREWYASGLGVPDEVRSATDEYRDEMDTLGGFLDECCVVEPEAKVTAKDLYATYQRWAEGNGERARSQKALSLGLVERAFAACRGTKGVRCWKGLRLRAEDEPLSDGWRVSGGDGSSGYSSRMTHDHDPRDHADVRGEKHNDDPAEDPEHPSSSVTRHSSVTHDDEWEEGDL